MKSRKGIVLAGGSGTRLYPLTIALSKQLLPVYDKPMIYYPISTLILAGIEEILIITTPSDLDQFQQLLGDGKKWGVHFTYLTQPEAGGIAQAFHLAEDFLDGYPSCLILGDNIHYGQGLFDIMQLADQQSEGATVFAYHVADPERYGIIDFDDEGNAISVEEKPEKPKSYWAITGLYFYDEKVIEYSKQIEPSARGEYEITAINDLYLQNKQLSVQKMGIGFAWFDTGTHDSLLEASNYVAALEKRQGLLIGCPEYCAYRRGLINRAQLEALAKPMGNSHYGARLVRE